MLNRLFLQPKIQRQNVLHTEEQTKTVGWKNFGIETE